MRGSISIGNSIVEIRGCYDHLIFTMTFPKFFLNWWCDIFISNQVPVSIYCHYGSQTKTDTIKTVVGQFIAQQVIVAIRIYFAVCLQSLCCVFAVHLLKSLWLHYSFALVRNALLYIRTSDSANAQRQHYDRILVLPRAATISQSAANDCDKVLLLDLVSRCWSWAFANTVWLGH